MSTDLAAGSQRQRQVSGARRRVCWSTAALRRWMRAGTESSRARSTPATRRRRAPSCSWVIARSRLLLVSARRGRAGEPFLVSQLIRLGEVITHDEGRRAERHASSRAARNVRVLARDTSRVATARVAAARVATTRRTPSLAALGYTEQSRMVWGWQVVSRTRSQDHSVLKDMFIRTCRKAQAVALR